MFGTRKQVWWARGTELAGSTARCGTKYLLGGPSRATVEGTSSLALLAAGRLLRRLGHLARAGVALLHRLDDADGDGLAHVADGKAAERCVLGERLHAHRLLRHHLDDRGVARLDEARVVLELLAAAPVDLLEQLAELARDVRRVAVQHRRVAGVDLTRVIQNDHLRVTQTQQTARSSTSHIT